MKNNLGKKIIIMSKLIMAISVIGSLCYGFYYCVEIDAGIGVVIMGLGVLSSWCVSLLIAGFGQLVHNSDIIASRYMQEEPMPSKPPKTRQIKGDLLEAPVDEDSFYDIVCPHCKQELSFLWGEIMNSTELTCPACEQQIPARYYRQ